MSIIELGNQIVQSSLSFDEFIKVLELINSKLRGKENLDKETGIYQGDMIVEGLVSPSNEMQLKILKKLYDTLRQDLDPMEKGMICYYTLNNLHLFMDGNGRTSRFLYQLYCNNFNDEYLYHPDSVEDTSKRYKFEKDNNLNSVKEFLNTVNYNLFLNMLSSGDIYDCDRMHEYNRVSTFPVDLFADEHFKTTFLADDVVKELGSKAKEVARNISNTNCNFSIAGIAMCKLLTRRNELQKMMELNDQHFEQVARDYHVNTKGNLLFYVGSQGEYGSDVHTEKWDTATCKEFLSISEDLLLKQYDMIVEASKYFVKKNNKDLDYEGSILR